MDKREIAKKRVITAGLNQLLYGEIIHLKDTVVRVRLILLVMNALDVLEK